MRVLVAIVMTIFLLQLSELAWFHHTRQRVAANTKGAEVDP